MFLQQLQRLVERIAPDQALQLRGRLLQPQPGHGFEQSGQARAGLAIVVAQQLRQVLQTVAQGGQIDRRAARRPGGRREGPQCRGDALAQPLQRPLQRPGGRARYGALARVAQLPFQLGGLALSAAILVEGLVPVAGIIAVAFIGGGLGNAVHNVGVRNLVYAEVPPEQQAQVWSVVGAAISGAAALLLAMGIPNAVLWGALAFLFGFIPSIGFLLSLVGPALMALLISGPQAAAVVIVAFHHTPRG